MFEHSMHRTIIRCFIFLVLLSIVNNKLIAQEKVSFLARVNPSFDLCQITDEGILLNTQIGNILTLKLTESEAITLKKMQGIDEIIPAQRITPNLKKVILDLRADSVYQGLKLKTGYTGKDVIIGITDWGFDYTHPMFYDSALKKTRILAAWDQFKTSGPSPSSFNYGTIYNGEQELLNAEKDTFNIYQYATHGSHVAGIAGGGGAGIGLNGIAYNANFLMVTFLANEASVIDGIAWMKQKAEALNKRLVINMSWGLYNLGPLDGTSLLSQALNSFSTQGVIFVTSGGNNGDVNFHIKKTFNSDTLQTQIAFYPYSAHPKMWGQRISMWGEKAKPFAFNLLILDATNKLVKISNVYKTEAFGLKLDSMLIYGNDTVFYTLEGGNSNPFNQNPYFQLRVQNKSNSLKVAIKAFANQGTVHFYNVTELSNNVGNWGMPFNAILSNWTAGDNLYGLGEPASTESVITVAAHNSELRWSNGNVINGGIANFSSIGPTIDNRQKPDISAPGVSVESSISSYTTNSYTPTQSVSFNGTPYPFARFSGTSMSSPAVTGVVALMLETNPKLSAENIKLILRSTARQDNQTGAIPSTGSPQWGFGKVDALAAVQMAEKLNLITIADSFIPSFTIFPNPAKYRLYFSGEFNKNYSAKIYDLNGKLVKIGALNQTEGFLINDLQNGVYLVKVDGFELGFRLVIL